jgi:hypothetical protein
MSDTKRCDVTKLKPGDKFYRIIHYEVTSVDGDMVSTKSDTAGLSSISASLVERSAFATNQYATEERITRTQLAQKIETLGHAAFRVKFNKQVNANDVADGLEGKDTENKTKRRKVIKALMKGEERIMHARLFRTDDFDASMELGRYRVIDLEAYANHDYDEARSMRLVDTRTVNELVVDNVRYYIEE